MTEPSSKPKRSSIDFFVLHPRDLEQLAHKLSSLASKIRYEIRCSDGKDRAFDNLADLVAYDNLGSRSITALTVSADNPSTGTKFFVIFANVSKSVDFRIEGPENVADDLVAFMRELIQEMRPWYSRVLPTPFTVAMLGGGGLAATMNELRVGSTNRRFEDAFPFTSIWLTLVVTFVAGSIFFAIWKRNFPMGSFAIGYGERRHHDREMIRLSLVMAFIVSVLAGVVLMPPVLHFFRSLF